MTCAARPVPFLRRVRVTDYRSIADCDVAPPTVPPGFSPAEKSSLLDAVRFVADAVADSPQRAISDRGGLEELLRRTPVSADSFRVQLDLIILLEEDSGQEVDVSARYDVQIGRDSKGELPFVVMRERCSLGLAESPSFIAADETFRRAEGRHPGKPRGRTFAWRSLAEVPADLQLTRRDHLFLPAVATTEEPFRRVYAAVLAAGSYEPLEPAAGEPSERVR